MKRLCLAFFFSFLCLAGSAPNHAQDQTALLAERRDMDERYKRLVAELEDMKDAYRAMQRRTSALAEEITKLREENSQQAQALSKFATKEDLRKNWEKLQEVDGRREADRKVVLEQLDKVVAAVAAGAAAPARREEKPPERRVEKPVDPNQEYYTYKVQSGDYLSTIVQAYNVQFKKDGKKLITVDQVLDANPGLKPNQIFVGKEILIPVPK